MTWAETMEVLDWMTPRFTEVVRWSEERVQAFHDDLLAWPKSAVMRAVVMVYEDGGKTPNGGILIRKMRTLGYRPATSTSLDHDHVWSIVEYEDERPDGLRLVQCSWRTRHGEPTCLEERTVEPSTIRTESEIRPR